MNMNYTSFSLLLLLITFRSSGMHDPFSAITNLIHKKLHKEQTDKQETREAIHQLKHYRAKRAENETKEPTQTTAPENKNPINDKT
jgi:hypothetical protein